jgi:hypothetical protein
LASLPLVFKFWISMLNRLCKDAFVVSQVHILKLLQAFFNHHLLPEGLQIVEFAFVVAIIAKDEARICSG